MLPKLISAVCFSCLLLSCDRERESVVKRQQEKVASTISIGDDIFAAKDKLVAEGFRIEYGPDSPTKSRSYLMMIVDYGVQPNGLETFKYTAGIEGGDEPIVGIIKASSDGTITSIE